MSAKTALLQRIQNESNRPTGMDCNFRGCLDLPRGLSVQKAVSTLTQLLWGWMIS